MTATATPRFSLVIPAYNEAALLPRLLDSVNVARRACRRGENDVEVIVADNMSTDATTAIAQARGCKVVRVEKRVIGAVRNGGARVATGAILCSVDADARIHPEKFNAIEDALDSGRIVGGASGVRPERWSIGFAATWALLVPIVVLMKMDTGVVFCRREDFEAVGGYDETRLFAEDVAFLLALRTLGRKRKQRLTRLRTKAIASVRKFDEFGDWHYFRLVWQSLPLMLGRRTNQMTSMVERYWYKPKR
jgi:glycosyltransferase involved in cell wall biosynthesis